MIKGPGPPASEGGVALAVVAGEATATGAVDVAAVVAGAAVAGVGVAGAIVATVACAVGATVGTGVGCAVRTVGTGVGATVGGGVGATTTTTTTVPLMVDGWNAHSYAKVPATVKVIVFALPWDSAPVSNEPPVALALCCEGS